MDLVSLMKEDRELIEEGKRLRRRLEEISARRKQIYEVSRALTVSIDPSALVLAASILSVHGNALYQADVITDAIHDLASGSGRLRREYFGSKNYDRWTAQRSDHSYGFGPSHGSIAFSVGLRVRDRDLTAEEVAACVSVLMAVGHGRITPGELVALQRESAGG